MTQAASTCSSSALPAVGMPLISRDDEQHAGERGEQAGQHVGDDAQPIDGEAGEPRRLLVAADEIDLAQERAVAERQIAEQDDQRA